MKFAVLQTGHAPETLWPKHGDYDAMSMITGSPSGVYDGDGWMSDLEDFIRSSYANRSKMIGICFGHQIMAQSLGGEVVKSDKGYGIGVMDYVLAGQQETLSLCAWHQDQVVQKPDMAEVIFSSNFCPIAGLSYGDDAISFQPHPEFTKDFVRDLIAFRRGDTITDAQADEADASMAKDIDLSIVQNMLLEFLGR